jgi:hypothetical protein
MFQEMRFSTYHELIASDLRAALIRYYDEWLDIVCKEEVERPQFLSSIEEKRISVVVLTCALLENAINFYLCTKCDAARFKDLQRKRLDEKWTTIPREFVPGYNLAAGSELARDLKSLIRRRNVIVHAKPMVSIDGDNRHAGNEPAIAVDENALIERCVSIPFRLLEHLFDFDGQAFMSMISVSTACGSVTQELNGARARLDYAARLPEELVAEIMAQGYRRERARLFAALIGPVPRRRSDGSIPVRRYGEVIALLKPLKSLEGSGFELDLSEPELTLQRGNQAHEGVDEL